MTTPSGGVIPAEANERQPLLDPQRDAVRADFEDSLGEPEALPPRRKRSKAEIAWYILLGLLSAFVLAVFIKGFIDSEDVDVRRPRMGL